MDKYIIDCRTLSNMSKTPVKRMVISEEVHARLLLARHLRYPRARNMSVALDLMMDELGVPISPILREDRAAHV